MTLARLFVAAGLMAASLGIGTAASAQPHDDHHRAYHYSDGRDRDYRHNAHGRWDRGDRGHRGRHCYTEWRHHHRVRVCR